jgi:hypothetical protein
MEKLEILKQKASFMVVVTSNWNIPKVREIYKAYCLVGNEGFSFNKATEEILTLAAPVK